MRSVWFHWQNLNDRAGGTKGWALRHGRCWAQLRGCHVGLEWTLLGRFRLGVSCRFSREEEPVHGCFSVGFASVYWHITTGWMQRLVRRVVPRDYSSEREISLMLSGWRFEAVPWRKTMESSREDRWFHRGLVIHIDEAVADLLLGKQRYKIWHGPGFPICVDLDGRHYRGSARRFRQSWKRPRWVERVKEGTEIDMIDGLPFAGKGETSYDCGDDALYGWSVEGDVQAAIDYGIKQTLKNRQRYGMPAGIRRGAS